MIDIPYEETVRRIHQETGLSIAEIQARVDAKMQSLAGLVSRDGAASILASELGVQMTRAPPVTGAHVKVKDISLQSRNITVSGRVIRKYEVKAFNKNGREGRVASLLMGDETGVTRLVFWNEQVDAFAELKENDILVVKNPFVKTSFQQDRLELQLNTQSAIVVNPEGVSVETAAIAPRAERPPAVQKYIRDLAGDEENVELIATIVQVYDPRFFDACPKCNKKLIGDQCAEHGAVVPTINYSMSALLDDGTGTPLRTSFWRQQAQRLTGKSDAEFQRYRDDPAAFEEVKNDLLGEFVKVVGRVKRNETFDRVEFTANLVFTDLDPAKELESLQKKFEAAPLPTHKLTSVTDETVVRETQKGVETEETIAVVEDDVVSLDDLDSLSK